MHLWLRWKKLTEVIRAAVIADVAEAGDLSEPELTVLIHLRRAGGSIRQNALTASTGWDRTRLSHLLTRMEARGYLSRSRLSNGVELAIEKGGTDVMARTQPLLAAAVQRHLTGRLTPAQLEALDDILKTLNESE